MTSNAAVYEKVTARILAAMEKGVAPWVKPWHKGTAIEAPVNAATGRAYSGFNVLALWCHAAEMGYNSRGWVTFKQALECGAVVRKGEKASDVFYSEKKLKRSHKEAAERGEEADGDSHYWLARMFYVFNLDQLADLPDCEGAVQKLRERAGDVRRKQDVKPDARVQEIIDRCGINVAHSEAFEACYMPALDVVRMPTQKQFKKADQYASVVLHELIHWTGHPSRLARRAEGEQRTFGSEKYAFEELIAELGAAFLGARLGVQAIDQSTAYLAHWTEVFTKLGSAEAKARALMNAVHAATQAADLLLPIEQKQAAEEAA